MIYRALFGWLLARLSPETAHSLAARGLAALGRVPGVRAALRASLGRADPCLRTTLWGLSLPSPLGAAAGLDKDLSWFEDLGALGFGYVEAGTITALDQPGNPRPRIHRLPADRALINSMGFPNRGAAAAARRLSGRRHHTVLALNVGRSRAAPDAAEDYRLSVRELARHADMLVLNVSSPNTPGLRSLQAVDLLGGLVAAVRGELAQLGLRVPLLVKIAPDLTDAEVDAIATAALQLGLDGIVAVNTTVARPPLASPPQLAATPGGLSGPPLAPRAVEVLHRLRAITGDRLVLVSVGGISTAQDAWERICAGATLVQAYTGFVYGGPLWPARINRGLARRVRAAGATSVGEVVGTGAPGGSGRGAERPGAPAASRLAP